MLVCEKVNIDEIKSRATGQNCHPSSTETLWDSVINNLKPSRILKDVQDNN